MLTAAHCLFDRDTKERIDHSKVRFLAGWRNGRAGAYRDVRRAVVHPDYVYDGVVSSDRVRNDLALLELQRPINNTTIKPFGTAACAAAIRSAWSAMPGTGPKHRPCRRSAR